MYYGNANSGVAGGHMGGKTTTRKVLQEGLSWPTRFRDAKEYAKKCDIYQCMGKPSH